MYVDDVKLPTCNSHFNWVASTFYPVSYFSSASILRLLLMNQSNFYLVPWNKSWQGNLYLLNPYVSNTACIFMFRSSNYLDNSCNLLFLLLYSMMRFSVPLYLSRHRGHLQFRNFRLLFWGDLRVIVAQTGRRFDLWRIPSSLFCYWWYSYTTFTSAKVEVKFYIWMNLYVTL